MRSTRALFVFTAIFIMSCSTPPDPQLVELEKKQARFAPVELKLDTSKLDSGDQQALAKLVDAARVIDDLYRNEQVWAGNAEMRAKLAKDTTPLGQARLRAFDLNQGPWSDLDEHASFIPDAPKRRPLGANFYPEDMKKEDFEAWVGKLRPEQREVATGFFTVIRGKGQDLTAIPYSVAYQEPLNRAARLLKEAAALTSNATLRKFLTLRAEAFLDNDYYKSDVAWMKVDAPIDATIGPYEAYMDEVFGYKAAFEAYITLRDDA